MFKGLPKKLQRSKQKLILDRIDMKRFACAIEYMGQGYQGWQSQKGTRTVQSQVELALAKVANENITVHCAGRTDSGVHSFGQIIHFDTVVSRESFACVRGVNSYLPRDIRFRWCTETANDFHARYSAIARKYTYFIYKCQGYALTIHAYFSGSQFKRFTYTGVGS